MMIGKGRDEKFGKFWKFPTRIIIFFNKFVYLRIVDAFNVVSGCCNIMFECFSICRLIIRIIMGVSHSHARFYFGQITI